MAQVEGWGAQAELAGNDFPRAYCFDSGMEGNRLILTSEAPLRLGLRTAWNKLGCHIMDSK